MTRQIFQLPDFLDDDVPVPRPHRSSTLLRIPQFVIVYTRGEEAMFGTRGRRKHGNGCWDIHGYCRITACRNIDQVNLSEADWKMWRNKFTVHLIKDSLYCDDIFYKKKKQYNLRSRC